ncbi:GNAT family N-acetyltransferase [Rhizobium oryzicola]|uniref:GNAT family N-acetyltransferase n=1 Tax=Rhizobium oryzicola TaxID=1232668 RepID=A0ABT8SV49_9HYPH|nr:GNAT family N-acetyltransferase [Rhizobium oryzicola]MDO1582297.1 GNAT family N-acetyltransferase [Rhizobium oryzicola]
MDMLELTNTPSDADTASILAALAAFNEADIGPSNRQPLAILIRDDEGEVSGGLYGYTGWGWLFTQYLVVPEVHRGQGVAGKMLEMAEAEAKSRGCHGAWIDTFNPVALKTYQRQGYEIFGQLPEFPKGRTRTFLKKSL